MELTAEFVVCEQTFTAVLPESTDRDQRLRDKLRAEGRDLPVDEYIDRIMEELLLDDGAQRWRKLREDGSLPFVQAARIWDWLNGRNRSYRRSGKRQQKATRKMTIPKGKR